LNSQEHSHVPFVVILVKTLQKWRNEHGGAVPSTRAEKDAFKQLINPNPRTPEEENFIEAHKAAMKAWTPPTIPEDVQTILSDEKAINISGKPSEFWILAAALKEFVANEGKGQLPLSGSIPDMVSDTNGYITLQRIYHEKAAADVNALANHVDSVQTKLGRASPISPDIIKKFCKNARFLKVVRFRSLEEEYNTETALTSTFSSQLEDVDGNFVYYIALRAVDRFFSTNSRYPGYFTDALEMETDISALKTCANSLLTELGLSGSVVKDEPIHEIVRFGAAELHPIASLLGGVASQEIIKLITHQYVPLNNTLIFNGINGSSLSIAL